MKLTFAFMSSLEHSKLFKNSKKNYFYLLVKRKGTSSTEVSDSFLHCEWAELGYYVISSL